jgi:hypothetical protein
MFTEEELKLYEKHPDYKMIEIQGTLPNTMLHSSHNKRIDFILEYLRAFRSSDFVLDDINAYRDAWKYRDEYAMSLTSEDDRNKFLANISKKDWYSNISATTFYRKCFDEITESGSSKTLESFRCSFEKDVSKLLESPIPEKLPFSKVLEYAKKMPKPE